MTPRIPQRIAAAVELLAIQPYDYGLEICTNLVRAGFVIKHETATEQVYCLASSLPAPVELKPAGIKER